MGSYLYSANQITFVLDALNQDTKRKNVLLEYMRVVPLHAVEDIFHWRDIGNYSICGFRIQIKRRSFKFIFNNYIPSALFVLVSWVSFLIPPDLIPGRYVFYNPDHILLYQYLRLNLLVGLFLVLINSFNNVTSKIPNSEGINALVVYLFTCIFFVFGAMCGYAGINQNLKYPRIFSCLF